MISVAGVAAGVVMIVVALALVDDPFLELTYDSRVIPLVAAGFGTALLGAAWRTPWRRSAALFLLFVTSQAAALQLLTAPRYAVYHHYVPVDAIWLSGPWIYVVIFQAAASGMLTRGARAVRAAISRASPIKIVLIAVPVVFWAAIPTVGVPRFAGETTLSLFIAAAALLNALALGMSLPEEPLARIESWLAERIPLAPGHPARGRWQGEFVVVAAVAASGMAAFFAYFVLQATPHISDAVAYLFQARYLAEGRLSLPAPPDASAFEVAHVVIDGGRWYSKYFPGWPGVLALGVALGSPWLVNPILAGLSIVLAHAIISRLYQPWLANAAVLLLLFSPWFLFMSASFMAHPVSLVWMLGAMLAVERARSPDRPVRWAGMAGALVGMLFLTRPLEAVLVAPVLGIWAFKGGPRPWGARACVAGVICGLLVAGLQLPINRSLTGSFTETPFDRWSQLNYGPDADRLGFGSTVGIPDWDSVDPLPGHGAVDVVLNLNKNLSVTNVDLFGWPFGSLLIPLAGMVLLRWREADKLMVGIVGAIIVGHFAYWFPGGPDLGARYWYLLIVPLAVLSVVAARGLVELAGPDRAPAAGRRLTAVMFAAGVAAFVTFVPWRAWTKYYRYRDIGSDAAHQIESLDQPSVVFVRSDRPSDFESVFNLNPIPLGAGGNVVGWDRGSESRDAILSAYPHLPVRYLERTDGPRLTLQ